MDRQLRHGQEMRIGRLEELAHRSVGVNVNAADQVVARRDDRDLALLLLDDHSAGTARLNRRPFGDEDDLVQADPERAPALVAIGGAGLTQVDVPGIANPNEAGLHVDPVRQPAELAGSDLSGDLEAVAEDIDVDRDSLVVLFAAGEPVVIAVGVRCAERSPDRVEARRRSEAAVGAPAVRVAESDGRIADEGARAES